MDIKTFESLSCKEQIHLKGMAGAPNSPGPGLSKSANKIRPLTQTRLHIQTRLHSVTVRLIMIKD